MITESRKIGQCLVTIAVSSELEEPHHLIRRLSETTFRMISHIQSDVFNVQYKIVRHIQSIESDISYVEYASDYENACFLVSAQWISSVSDGDLHRRILPLLHTHVRLHRHSSHMRQIAPRHSAYALNYIYNICLHLQHSPIAMHFELTEIMDFKRSISELAGLSMEDTVHRFYLQKIWSREHHVGGMMNLVIAARISLDSKQPIFIDGKEASDISTLFKNTKSHMKVSEKIAQITRGTIDKTDFSNFLNYYEESCQKLGIPESYRILTQAAFRQLKEAAAENAMRAAKSRLETHGFHNISRPVIV